MASEATKMAVRCNMHMDARVIKVADFNPVVKLEFRPFGGQLVYRRISSLLSSQ